MLRLRTGALVRLSLVTLLAAPLARAADDVAVVAVNSNAQDLGGFKIEGFEPASLSVFHLNVTAQATWSGTLSTQVSWNADDVRQGAQLAVSRSSPAATGAIHVLWTLTGNFSPLGIGSVDIGTIPISGDAVSCAPQLSGGGYTCTATSDTISLLDTPCIPLSPYVSLGLQIDFDITPDGAIATRSFTIDGDPQGGSADLSLTDSAQTETFAMSCTRQPGDAVKYALAPIHWKPATHTTQQAHIIIGVRDPGYALGCTKLPAIYDAPFGDAAQADPAFDLASDGHTADLGALQANNVPPAIAPMSNFTGNEGSPVQFSASVQSRCPIGASVWQFSDGTMSFGPAPQRAFGDDGQYTGQLGVTDVTNMSASADFTVSIANVPPVPDAGPDTSGAFNRPIAFHGQAVDPGWNDQATLVYSWDFGDGTPGTGGANALHAYAAPGDYVATLKVCDDHTCSFDTANVHVRRRATVAAYTGATSGVYSAPMALMASVDDEFGEPVTGAQVAFAVAGNAAGSAQTDSSGNAQASTTPALAAGSYPVSASYGGSAYYVGSAATGTVAVSQMATAVAYTGALAGGPNKTITLSAVLTDALGRGLDGKVIVFKLGAQTASATTAGGGIASVALKLTQKQGSYPLTATYAPSTTEAAYWSGASAVKTFALSSK